MEDVKKLFHMLFVKYVEWRKLSMKRLLREKKWAEQLHVFSFHKGKLYLVGPFGFKCPNLKLWKFKI